MTQKNTIRQKNTMTQQNTIRQKNVMTQKNKIRQKNAMTQKNAITQQNTNKIEEYNDSGEFNNSELVYKSDSRVQ